MSPEEQQNKWNVSPEEARNLQKSLRKQIELTPLGKEIKLIAGADISFNKFEETVYAGFVVMEMATLKPFAYAAAIAETRFPYIPGLLSFREIPALLLAWEMLEVKPDVVMLDGHGIAHPRRMGIATHFGLTTGCPTIGVAKKRLTGSFTEPDAEAGSFSELISEKEKETIGIVYRTKNRVKPVFISPGNKTCMSDALMLVKKTTGKYRIPEPTRQAHLLVNQLRRDEIKQGFHLYT